MSNTEIIVRTTRTDNDSHLEQSGPGSSWIYTLSDVVGQRFLAGDYLDARRFIWRAVRSPLTTASWLKALDDVRQTAGVRTIPFNLARKPGRHFLNHRLSYASKIGLLAGHYRQLLSTIGVELTAGLLEGRAFTIAEFSGKSGAYLLLLARNERFGREGEIIVDLKRVGDDQPLATLSLVLGALSPGDGADLWIGGLQGCKGEHSKGETIAVTRDLWGLRPKDLMMVIAYRLGEVFGAIRLKAISNEAHVLRRPSAKSRKPIADYDAYWAEIGGAPLGDGFFLLPPTRRIRLESEVSAAKRKTWRARHALIADIEAQVFPAIAPGLSDQDSPPPYRCRPVAA